MKKKIALAVLVVLALVLLNSCGMSWKQTWKNLRSNYTGGIDRELVVENLYTGAVERTYSGKAFINDDAKSGNFSISYWDGNVVKTDDFIGIFYGVKSYEK